MLWNSVVVHCERLGGNSHHCSLDTCLSVTLTLSRYPLSFQHQSLSVWCTDFHFGWLWDCGFGHLEMWDACVYKWTHVYVCLFVCMCVHVYVCTCVCAWYGLGGERNQDWKAFVWNSDKMKVEIRKPLSLLLARQVIACSITLSESDMYLRLIEIISMKVSCQWLPRSIGAQLIEIHVCFPYSAEIISEPCVVFRGARFFNRGSKCFLWTPSLCLVLTHTGGICEWRVSMLCVQG